MSQNEKAVWVTNLGQRMLRKGDALQLPGIVCPDCRGEIIARAGGYPIRSKPLVGQWCDSDQHPLFDERGYLIQMTRV